MTQAQDPRSTDATHVSSPRRWAPTQSSIQLRVVEIARSWIGTPYRHQGLVKGFHGGVDCLGLIVGIYQELYGEKPKYDNNYTPWWAEETGRERIVVETRQYLQEIQVGEAIPGDMVVYAMRARGIAKHGAILSGEGMMIHSYAGHGVMETPMFRHAPKYAFRFHDPKDHRQLRLPL